MSTVMLALDGEAVLLQNLLVTPSMQFQEKDQSGQSSSTASSEQGIKAKELRVSGMVKFSEQDKLTRIFTLAEATDSAGKQKVYRVANLVASAINFREATFTSSIDATPQQNLMAWLVNFTLREKSSVPEKKAARSASASQKSKSQSADGSVVEDLSEPEEQLSWFEENVLRPTNEALGG